MKPEDKTTKCPRKLVLSRETSRILSDVVQPRPESLRALMWPWYNGGS
jgi:hypothetical protein